jgi:hypothetical protein
LKLANLILALEMRLLHRLDTLFRAVALPGGAGFWRADWRNTSKSCGKQQKAQCAPGAHSDRGAACVHAVAQPHPSSAQATGVIGLIMTAALQTATHPYYRKRSKAAILAQECGSATVRTPMEARADA